MPDRTKRVDALIEKIPTLTDGQLFWLDNVIKIFERPYDFKIVQSDLIDEKTLLNFGDALRIHHSFSLEAFSKDKFEYVLETVLNINGTKAKLSSKGKRGHDIVINNVPVSLKTQADKNISQSKIWISKFMELGGGKWWDDPNDLIGLRQEFLDHMKDYERIFTLRALKRSPNWYYELVEMVLPGFPWVM